MPNPVTEGLQEARALRRSLNFDAMQPIEPGQVALQLGIIVVRRPLRSSALWGIHLYDEFLKRHLVLLNSAQPTLRQRFTLAHEIGHARFDRATLVEDLAQQESTPEEKRANAFAAELLMPETAAKRWIPAHPWGENIDDVADLALHFGASFQMTAWRLQTAGLVDSAQNLIDRLPELATRLRAALRKPGDSETEYPLEYVSLVEQGLQRGLVSRGRAEELLSVNEDL